MAAPQEFIYRRSKKLETHTLHDLTTSVLFLEVKRLKYTIPD